MDSHTNYLPNRVNPNTLEALFQHAPVGLASLDREGCFLQINNHLARLNGCSVEEHVGRTVEAIAPHWWSFLQPHFIQALLGTPILKLEGSGTFPARGEDCHWIVNLQPIRVEGNVVAVGLSVQDITEQRRAEHALAMRNNLYAMLSRTSQAVSGCRSREALYQEVCQIAVDVGRFRLAWVGVPDNHHVKRVAWAGEDHGHLQEMPICLDEQDALSLGPIEQAARLGEARIVTSCQIATLPSPCRTYVQNAGFSAFAALPLKERGQVVAVLTLYAGETDFFTDDMQTTLREITPSISYALDQLAQEQERQRAEECLRENEHLFQVAFGTVKIAAFRQDLQLRYNWLYQPARGYEQQAVIGKTDADLFAPEDAALLTRLKQDVLRTGNSRRQEVQLTRANQTYTYELTLEPIRDNGEIVGLIGASLDITDGKQHEAALHLLDRAVQSVSQGILISDARKPNHPILYASHSFERLTGYKSEDILGRSCRFLQGEKTDPKSVAQVREAIRAGKECTVELLNYRKDGSSFWNQLTLSPVYSDDGELVHFVGVQTDVTERRRLEEHLRQAQKMEAVGQLAGGVAHDFNNLLTVINGYSEMLLAQTPLGDPIRDQLLEVYQAGQRAGTLTRQLLAFSRQQVVETKLVNLNTIVSDTEKMLRRLIGEDVLLTTKLGAGLGLIRADAGQLEQVLINLAINSRDAMPGGGKLNITTKRVRLDSQDCPPDDTLIPGNYVLLQVSDTGCGMDSATQARIFEPFFTTKGVGKGTGLGLATVHGIIKQSKGHISVVSNVGKGTTFNVYLPQSSETIREATAKPRSAYLPMGSETILLVEDEEAVRTLARYILQSCGHQVLEATDGQDALALAFSHPEPIQLVISDVVMPHLGGRELVERLTQIRPECKVLFLSGYTDEAVTTQGVRQSPHAFLEKPFSPSALAQKVRSILNAR